MRREAVEPVANGLLGSAGQHLRDLPPVAALLRNNIKDEAVLICSPLDAVVVRAS